VAGVAVMAISISRMAMAMPSGQQQCHGIGVKILLGGVHGISSSERNIGASWQKYRHRIVKQWRKRSKPRRQKQSMAIINEIGCRRLAA